MDVPDLTGAEVYIAPNSIAHGRWYILPTDTDGVERVVYERADDQCEHPDTDKWVLTPLVSAHELRTSPTWTPLPGASRSFATVPARGPGSVPEQEAGRP